MREYLNDEMLRMIQIRKGELLFAPTQQIKPKPLNKIHFNGQRIEIHGHVSLQTEKMILTILNFRSTLQIFET